MNSVTLNIAHLHLCLQTYDLVDGTVYPTSHAGTAVLLRVLQTPSAVIQQSNAVGTLPLGR